MRLGLIRFFLWWKRRVGGGRAGRSWVGVSCAVGGEGGWIPVYTGITEVGAGIAEGAGGVAILFM